MKNDQWHKDHKKAIAEKWVQCPQIEARAEELRQKWATGQIGISALCKAHAHAENEIAELKAELAEARAEINIIEHDANVLIGDIKAELERKDKLVEQMREALAAAKNDGKTQSAITYQLIKAALSAAERGEG